MGGEIIAFDIPGIMSCQQNRYPMLFIDQVTECVPLEYAKGYKLFTYNEWYFHGYETAVPKVWSAIQTEAMSQMFLMTFLSAEENRGYVAMSNRFSKVNFYRKITPGDKLDLEANLESFKHGIARGKVEGYVEGALACSMECTIVVPDLFGKFQHALSAKAVESSNKNQLEEPPSEIDFGIEKIRECMLNRYPWLYLDRVLDIKEGEFVRAIKNFTYNEEFFPSHFPGDPSVPGFIQIECCMQSFLLTFLSLDEYKRKETADRMLSNVQLRRKIVPGETLELFAKLNSFSRGVAKGRVETFVGGEEAISFDVTAVVIEELDRFKPK